MNARMRDALVLLKGLISLSSYSGEEDKTANLIEGFFKERSVSCERIANNLIVRNRHFDPGRPSVLLNSHHDTVRPNAGWARNPLALVEEDGRLYGLGSNDAGGALVCLIAAFLEYADRPDLPANLILVASAEEEISGPNGIELVLRHIDQPDFAIVGEPTQLRMAVAEKGLMVLDCEAEGRSGHAARSEGVNAIYAALPDIEWFRTYRFPEESATLGPVKMSVTQIQAGTQHNVVPDVCRFVVDVRTTDAYSNEEVLGIISQHVRCRVVARSTRLQPSGISPDHPLVLAARRLGIDSFGSPTCSDQALMPFPSVKIGPGDSARSHTADEYIGLDELQGGKRVYDALLNELFLLVPTYYRHD
jgi:acetylornithine deacetylase